MNERLTKRMVREALGFTRDRELADFFKTSKQAVSRWPEDEELPEGRQWQARALRPDAFLASPPSQDVDSNRIVPVDAA
ncbi:hypothetical protein [Xanthomonas maliensis]|nr:hypothetical protein [Xanthomonas maliensis]KAB7769330.1 hypothetical protein CKY51_07015 [Xanthomonas maliensis]